MHNLPEFQGLDLYSHIFRHAAPHIIAADRKSTADDL